MLVHPRLLAVVTAVAVAALAACGGSAGDDDDADADGADAEPEADAGTPVEVTAPTVDELLARDEPLLVAHAGGNDDAPQETLFAYATAVDNGADVLELDVTSTAEGAVVVHHDETVDRLTDGTGAVADMLLADLQQLDAAHWWAPGCTDGCRDLRDDAYAYRGVRSGDADPPEGFTADDFRVPTFAEVAEAFPDMPLDVEVKGTGAAAEATADALADEIERLGRTDTTIVVSFDAAVVEHVRERLPEVATSPGLDALADWILAGEPLGDHPLIQIPPTYEGVDLVALMVERAHDLGVDVWVWPDEAASQENAEYYGWLTDQGVDGVIAASPAVWPH